MYRVRSSKTVQETRADCVLLSPSRRPDVPIMLLTSTSVGSEDGMLICPYSSFTFASTQSADYDKSSFKKMQEINPSGGLRAGWCVAV